MGARLNQRVSAGSECAANRCEQFRERFPPEIRFSRSSDRRSAAFDWRRAREHPDSRQEIGLATRRNKRERERETDRQTERSGFDSARRERDARCSPEMDDRESRNGRRDSRRRRAAPRSSPAPATLIKIKRHQRPRSIIVSAAAPRDASAAALASN